VTPTTTIDASQVALRLDKDHLPETNGRMAVCRVCGTTTDSPAGATHVPSERQVARAGGWLDERARLDRVEQAKARMS
jgi:hypothetical protein